MERKADPFNPIQKALTLNVELVDEVSGLDLDTLHEDVRDMLLSQIRLTIGKLGKLVVEYQK